MPAIPVPTKTALGDTIGPSLTVPLQNVTLAEALSEVESRMISEALHKHKGNISRVARELGLTRRGLYLKIERYEIKVSA
ncbi:MAG TPA: helix-turn-helix domain-containing protein [Pyrinomonadaceae bacterium]|nr:helix-turn-helix domain-containing protein [Pyrinomonadaceae bacterium]